MQFEDQHVDAIRPTIRVKNEVTATIFSDKVTEMGRLTASKGRIEIVLDYLPGMYGEAAQATFVSEAIAVAIREAMLAHEAAFDPHSV
jgi:hypothetical protein